MIMKIEYFWETEYKFSEFLKTLFDGYYRKYSLEGNGIFNLLKCNGKLYEIKYTQARSHVQPDNHKFTDDKEFIINTIVSNLKCDANVSGGKFITFPVGSWIGKVEVIKKLAEPK